MDFCVTKLKGSLVKPSGPTPSGLLDLSRIDNVPFMRRHFIGTIHVYGSSSYGSLMGAAQSTIKEALSKALVPYYPLAGRLKDSRGGQLQVECSGEGVWFVEAFADCKLEDVGYFEGDYSSIPLDKLLPHQPCHTESIDPILLMQVTEFEGSGYVMGLKFCHSVLDGVGAAQVMNAIGEFARGLPTLTLPPVWQKGFLPPPPQQHHDQDHLPSPSLQLPTSFDYHLEPANIDIPLDRIKLLQNRLCCSTFEVLVAILWSHRTRAIYSDKKLDVEEQVKLVFAANCRGLLYPELPKGFYRNCFFMMTVTASSQALISAPIGDVVRLIQEAKSRLPLEFAKWRMNCNEYGSFTTPIEYTTLFVSEWARVGFNEVDYGHGPPRHVVPQFSSENIMPIVIMGSLPYPKKGIRLSTCCVSKPHLQPFLSHMSNLK